MGIGFELSSIVDYYGMMWFQWIETAIPIKIAVLK